MKYWLLVACLLQAVIVFGQTRQLRGVVVDEQEEPLAGVTVLIKGTSIATATDADGRFEIAVPVAGATLVFSYVGFQTREISVTTEQQLRVQLFIEKKLMDEVVVIGYGTQIRSQLTGSISSVEGEMLERLPVVSVEQGLQGKAAGVFIEANNGKVGGDIRVRIRGATSMDASNQPLFILDGIPINTYYINDGVDITLNPLADLDFNDIESVEILKDASASAIYGARGANGVVIITTKRGKSGKPQVTFDFQQGWSKPTRLREFLNGRQYVDYFLDAAVRGGKYAYRMGLGNFDSEQEAIDKYTQRVLNDLAQFANGTDFLNNPVSTDWQSLAFQKAPFSSADLDISGGSDRIAYYLSAGYAFQNGILLDNNAKRYNINTNLDLYPGKNINTGLSLHLIRNANNTVPNDYQFTTPMQIVAQAPITPLYDSTGELTNYPNATYQSPLVDAYNSFNLSVTWRSIGGVYAEYFLLPGLKLRGEAAADISNLNTNAYYGKKSDLGKPVGGYGYVYNSTLENYDVKLLLDYTRTWNEHTLSLMAANEYQRYKLQYSEADGTGFPNDNLNNLSSASQIVYYVGNSDEYRFLSYLGRAHYSLSGKYLFTLTGRYDGSSKFGENRRFGFFPSAAAGWVISREPFWNNNQTLSFLKLRTSYGITGNAEIATYQYAGLFTVSTYADKPGLSPYTLPNPDLSWEQTSQYDLGLDFGLLSDRINGQLDYYFKDTRDLLLAVPVSATTGFTYQTQNIGRVTNTGIEASVYADLFTGKFSWNAGLNVARNWNKVVEIAPGQDIIDYSGSDGLNVMKVGYPMGIYYGPEYAGVDPATGDALWYVNAEEGSRETTNDYNAAHWVILGDPNPKVIGGFNNTLTYGAWSLTLNFQGVFGHLIHLSGDHWMNGGAATYDNQIVEALNYWKQPGDITDVPEPRLFFDNGNQARSSRYLSDGSYLRLKNFSLGYDVPEKWCRKAHLNGLRLYMSAYNLLTLTRYEGWDPEVSADGGVSNYFFSFDFYSAPQPRTIVFGVNMKL
ncbi:MAG: TonB-dependent receptor [Chitinophagales bacterium]|nr:TonB-dependent receptor [Chitinophagales bacterium]MDW8427030.1 TonB-dependent receptor [Chitinophagales bacterium]